MPTPRLRHLVGGRAQRAVLLMTALVLASCANLWATAGPTPGFDKIEHAVASALLAAVLWAAARVAGLGRGRAAVFAAVLTLATGCGLELCQLWNLLGSSVSVLGGDAEVADVVADVLGTCAVLAAAAALAHASSRAPYRAPAGAPVATASSQPERPTALV